jgi:hypothetical protein
MRWEALRHGRHPRCRVTTRLPSGLKLAHRMWPGRIARPSWPPARAVKTTISRSASYSFHVISQSSPGSWRRCPRAAFAAGRCGRAAACARHLSKLRAFLDEPVLSASSHAATNAGCASVMAGAALLRFAIQAFAASRSSPRRAMIQAVAVCSNAPRVRQAACAPRSSRYRAVAAFLPE